MSVPGAALKRPKKSQDFNLLGLLKDGVTDVFVLVRKYPCPLSLEN